MIYHIELTPCLDSAEVIAGYYAPSLPEQGTRISIVPHAGPDGQAYERRNYEVLFIEIQVCDGNKRDHHAGIVLHAAAIVREVTA